MSRLFVVLVSFQLFICLFAVFFPRLSFSVVFFCFSFFFCLFYQSVLIHRISPSAEWNNRNPVDAIQYDCNWTAEKKYVQFIKICLNTFQCCSSYQIQIASTTCSFEAVTVPVSLCYYYNYFRSSLRFTRFHGWARSNCRKFDGKNAIEMQM